MRGPGNPEAEIVGRRLPVENSWSQSGGVGRHEKLLRLLWIGLTVVIDSINLHFDCMFSFYRKISDGFLLHPDGRNNTHVV